MKLIDIILIAVICAILILSVWRYFSAKKKNIGGCSSCDGCPGCAAKDSRPIHHIPQED